MTFTNPRWADAEHTSVVAMRGDGAAVAIPADLANADYLRLIVGDVDADVAPAPISKFERWPSLTAAKADLMRAAEDAVVVRRVRAVGTTDATKLAMYQQKYAVALGARDGAADALAQLEAEAGARGVSATALAALIIATGDRWRNVGQAIEAASAAHKTAIAGLADMAAAERYDVTAHWPVLDEE